MGVIASLRRRISWVLLAGLVVCLLLVAWQMAGLHGKLAVAMDDIRTTQHDNRTWVIAQADTDLLAYRLALAEVRMNPSDAAWKTLRQRFDIFYSRVETVRLTLAEGPALSAPHLLAAWAKIVAMTQSDALIFDAGNAAVQADLAGLEDRARRATPEVRAVVVETLHRLIESGMQLRERTHDLLDTFFGWTFLMNGTLVALAIGVILSLYWLLRYAGLKTLLSVRQTKVINAAIDAVLICDRAGNLLEYNAAARKLFGLEGASGALPRLSGLFVPGHRGSGTEPGLADTAPEDYWTSLAASSDIVPSVMRRGDGTDVPVECVFTAHSEMDGRPIIIVFVHDISRQLENEHRLEAARDAAERGERAKSRFLAVMSHEMRTPLNGLIAALDILQKTTRLTQRQAKFLQVARQCGATTLEQIDDVLELTRLDGLTPPEEPQEIDLGALLGGMVEQNRPMAAQRGNILRLTLPRTPLPPLLAPKRTLSRAAMNLLGNAMRFTQDGHIDLLLTAEPGEGDQAWFSLSVIDTGQGIAPERMDLIFRDFETEAPAGGAQSAGTGLGLGIVRRAMERMGGTVTAKSELGKGSAFTVRFPLKVLPQPEVAQAARPLAANAGQENAVARGVSVLIAEDNEINRLVLVEMLRHLGAKVDQAVDGQVAVSLAVETRYDLILMDLSMPRLDGVEATRIIRQGGASARTPIVGLTAHLLKEELGRMRAAGMVTALSKPVTIEGLQKILAEVGTGPEAVPDAPQQEVIEALPLASLAQALSAEALQDLLRRFVEETDEAVRILASDGPDADLAHRAAGSAAIFGAMRLRRALVDAEASLRRGDRIDSQGMERVRACWQETRDALLRWARSSGSARTEAAPIP